MSPRTKIDWKVIEKRAESAPDNFRIAILGKLLNKRNLVKAVHERSEIGREYAEMQTEYLKWCVKKVG